MSKPFAPIRNQRLSDKVTEQLLMAMRQGDLPVGTRLPPEEQLAKQFSVSRGILREGLTVLEARGFIKRTPKEGTVVQSVQGDELARALTAQMRKATYRDLLEFREVIECRAVENIVKIASDEEIAELAELAEIEPMGKDSVKVDHYFHYRVAELSGNTLFSSCIDMYYDLIREMRRKSLQNKQRSESVQKEHREIISTIRSRDAGAARRAIRSHLNAVRESVEEDT
ncbi:MAG: FCD domain-containing protein [Bacillota bacterium]